jgi:hypothetical protein
MATTKDLIGKKIKNDLTSRPMMSKNLVLRVPDELHQKLAEMAKQMSEEMPGHRVTISDVARGIIEWGLKDRKPTYRGFDSRDDPDEEG